MSSPRVQKIYSGLAEQLHRQGYKAAMSKDGQTAAIKWQGREATGKDACVIDLTSATWATGNLRAVLVAKPATDSNDTAAMKTQSHAAGHTLDGSVSFTLHMEAVALTNAGQASAHAKFQRELLHILRGQLGAPVSLQLTNNGTEPTVNGANGAVATAATTDAGDYMPYGLAVAGGV
jgi:nitrogen fixation protein FixH